MHEMQQRSPPITSTTKGPLSRALLWGLAVAALLAVFASYGQLDLLLQWVELKLC
jgi:hypothetical protein